MAGGGPVPSREAAAEGALDDGAGTPARARCRASISASFAVPTGTSDTGKSVWPSASAYTKRGFCNQLQVKLPAHLNQRARVSLLLLVTPCARFTPHNVLFECTFGHEDVDMRRTCLADTMDSLDCLSLYVQVPNWSQEDHAVCDRQSPDISVVLLNLQSSRGKVQFQQADGNVRLRELLEIGLARLALDMCSNID